MTMTRKKLDYSYNYDVLLIQVDRLHYYYYCQYYNVISGDKRRQQPQMSNYSDYQMHLNSKQEMKEKKNKHQS